MLKELDLETHALTGKFGWITEDYDVEENKRGLYKSQ
jgi:hypothetical protein